MALGIFKSKEDKYWDTIKEKIVIGRKSTSGWSGVFAQYLCLHWDVPVSWDKKVSQKFSDKHGEEYLKLISKEYKEGRFTPQDLLLIESIHLGGLKETTSHVDDALLSLIGDIALKSNKGGSVEKESRVFNIFSKIALKRAKKNLDGERFNELARLNILFVTNAVETGAADSNVAIVYLKNLAEEYTELLSPQYNDMYEQMAMSFSAGVSQSHVGVMDHLFDTLYDGVSEKCKKIVSENVETYTDQFNKLSELTDEQEQCLLGFAKRAKTLPSSSLPKAVTVSDLEVVMLSPTENLLGTLVTFNRAAFPNKHVLFAQKQTTDSEGKITADEEVVTMEADLKAVLEERYSEHAVPLAKKLTRSQPAMGIIV